HGVELYGNGVMVSRMLLAERPEVVQGLVRAVHRGVMDTIADPDAAMDALVRREPLIDRKLEKQRLLYTLQNVVFTDESRRIGLGDVDDARLQRAIAQVAQVFALPAAPSAEVVFTRAGLPPRGQRLPAPWARLRH